MAQHELPVGDGGFELLALESKSVWRHDMESIAVVILGVMENMAWGS